MQVGGYKNLEIEQDVNSKKATGSWLLAKNALLKVQKQTIAT